MIFYENKFGKLYKGDWIKEQSNIGDNTVDCICCSPPYWQLRNYNNPKQLGLEKNFENYVDNLIKGFNNIRRTLKDTGTLFVNLGDTYSGNLKANNDRKKKESVQQELNKPSTQYPDKCLLMIPERFALGMINDGWILRNKIIWHKPNQVPYAQNDGTLDRFNCSYEVIYFFTKINRDYNFTTQYESTTDCKDKRIMRDVWSLNTEALKGNHPATYPTHLVKRMIEAGCPKVVIECESCKQHYIREISNKGGSSSSQEWDKDRQQNRESSIDEKERSRFYEETSKETNNMPSLWNTSKVIGTCQKCGGNVISRPGRILDPFLGSGTTALVAQKLKYQWLGIELNEKYCFQIVQRLKKISKFS